MVFFIRGVVELGAGEHSRGRWVEPGVVRFKGDKVVANLEGPVGFADVDCILIAFSVSIL